MGILSVLMAVVIAALLGAGLWVLVRSGIKESQIKASLPAGQGLVGPEENRMIRSVYRTEVRAALVAFFAGCAATAAMIWVGSSWVQGYGLTYALAAEVGAIIGLIVYTLCPRDSWGQLQVQQRVAELIPRRATSFARRWVFNLPLVISVAFMLGLVVTGLYSVTDEHGLHRLYQSRSLSGWGVEGGEIIDAQYTLSLQGPFPGWYYGIPLIVVSVALVLTVYWSLRRVATMARPVSPVLFDADTTLRSLQTAFIMAASSAVLTFQLAGLLAVSGNVLRRSSLSFVPTADLASMPETVAAEPEHTLALVAIFSALVIVVIAIVLLVKSLIVIFDLWSIQSKARRSEATLVR
jgi:hypothetical protein